MAAASDDGMAAACARIVNSSTKVLQLSHVKRGLEQAISSMSHEEEVKEPLPSALLAKMSHLLSSGQSSLMSDVFSKREEKVGMSHKLVHNLKVRDNDIVKVVMLPSGDEEGNICDILS